MMTSALGVPPQEFGNRAFYGQTTASGNVVVIDSPSMVDRSLVPIDPTRDVLVHAAFAALAPSIGLLNRGFRGFIAVDAGIGRDEAGIGGFGRGQMAIAGLGILQTMAIPCAAVSHLTAISGDARSIYEDGEITIANALAEARGVRRGMPARAAADLLLEAKPG